MQRPYPEFSTANRAFGAAIEVPFGIRPSAAIGSAISRSSAKINGRKLTPELASTATVHGHLAALHRRVVVQQAASKPHRSIEPRRSVSPELG